MNDFRLSVLKPKYEELFNTCLLRSRWLEEIARVAQQLLQLRPTYDTVQAQTNVPWWVVGVLHYRDLNFQEFNQSNGLLDTVCQALRQRQLDKAKDQSMAAWLWRIEAWNGWGYASLGLNSEYLWNGTNHFGSGNNQGVFLSNGQFDANGTSQQIGAAALLWYLQCQGLLSDGVVPSQTTVSQGFGESMSFNTTVEVNQGFTATAQAVEPLTTIQLEDAFRYYQKLPQQNSAIAWLQQQLSPELLAEFARQWRLDSPPGMPPAITNGGQEIRNNSSNSLINNSSKTFTLPLKPPVAHPPRTLAQSIIAYCEEKRYKIDRGVGEKNIIYVEGMYPDGKLNNDTFNAWNDARLVIEFKNGTPEIIGAWEATTEPGQYYTIQPLNIAGAARIAFGQYLSWQVGTHGQSDPHEALIQTGGPVTVYRDLNQDGMRTGDRTDTGYFGINQHWGGDSPTSDIGAWSAGCLVGRTREGHRQFMALCKQDPRYIKNRGYVFQATVIPGDDLFKRYPPTIASKPKPGETANSSGLNNAIASPGQLNKAILTAASSLRGMSSAAGPDGGNNACAWSINRVLQKAGIPPLGENPNYVPSLLDDLKGGRGQLVENQEAKAGDLVIAYEEAHVGVGLDDGCQTVLSNSSSRASFVWESDTDFDGSYGGPSTIYRLLK